MNNQQKFEVAFKDIFGFEPPKQPAMFDAKTFYVIWNAAQVDLRYENDKLKDQNTKLLASIANYQNAIEITKACIESDEFWATAGVDDVDEIDLEEMLAQCKLFSVANDMLNGE